MMAGAFTRYVPPAVRLMRYSVRKGRRLSVLKGVAETISDESAPKLTGLHPRPTMVL